MQPLRPFLLVLCAGALALGGCGDGGSDAGSGGSSTAASDASQPSTSADGGVEVKMEGIAYNPATISVRPGQQITWVNDDDVLHDVVSTEGESIRSELFAKGRTFSFTPTRAGLIHYVCTIHPGMEGNIDVR
ncbi:plastocyanin/azurin family copper-binding protein [Conexibacter sp. CPCC 206217]|uniref:plastocyanin/azurin family copper-binding protein n=1 Tax=Conexibacter sp. CPCC 206217 TaxID=3064574 RepID=UPI00272285B8|nr:plastocyanin/azurin family copper-binding protein [Conexibacter sp. CPCC 206217]MDO8210740.1 plastocyanin/azurin family copper-binding protein [Conexibacter sp. CPCC 206217]